MKTFMKVVCVVLICVGVIGSGVSYILDRIEKILETKENERSKWYNDGIEFGKRFQDHHAIELVTNYRLLHEETNDPLKGFENYCWKRILYK